MTLSLNVVEAIWITITLVTLILTTSAYHDAWRDREAVRQFNGQARELAATGNVRREGFRVIVQALLLGIALPGLFSDREASINPIVIALMAVPVVLFLSSMFDAIDRRRMTTLVTADVLLLRNDALARIERLANDLAEAIADNTRISQEASDAADKAYHEANDVNRKIAEQGAALIQQGEDRAAAKGEIEP